MKKLNIRKSTKYYITFVLKTEPFTNPDDGWMKTGVYVTPEGEAVSIFEYVDFVRPGFTATTLSYIKDRIEYSVIFQDWYTELGLKRKCKELINYANNEQ